MNRTHFQATVMALSVGFGIALELEAATLSLISRTITWSPGFSPDLVAQLGQPSGQQIPALVKFKNPLVAADHATLLAAGVVLEDYLSDTSYAALLPTQTILINVPATSLVFAAELLLPTDRIPANLNPTASLTFNAQSNTIGMLVGFWRSVPATTVASNLTLAGLTGVRYGADNSWLVNVPVPSIPAFTQTLSNLATQNSIRSIQPGPPPFLPLNNQGRAKANTDNAQDFNLPLGSGKPAYGKLSGVGVKIAICDNGIAELHKDFLEIASGGAATGTRVYHSRADTSGHGTAVASIAAGNGFESESYSGGTTDKFLYRGHAPQAGIGDYPHFGGDAELFFKAIHDDGSDVNNHSYVQSFTVYDVVAKSLDDIVRGTGKNAAGMPIAARPSVWGAGNNAYEVQYPDAPPEEKAKGEKGYYSVFTSAKNTISVGSIDTLNGRRSIFSSLGPTFDGRIKPDVVAPGDRNPSNSDAILAAQPGSPAYFPVSGTSMAAPVVSGIIALMTEHYRKSCSPSCSDLQPALYKAVLVHTAKDLEKPVSVPGTYDEDGLSFALNTDTGAPISYDLGPDFATGYGLVDAAKACEKIGQFDDWIQSSIAKSGAVQEWCIKVPPGALELKAVIAWDDRPGSELTAHNVSRLVNDLDLVLIAPDGTVHQPWTLMPLKLATPPDEGKQDPISATDVTAAVRGADHLNNVEMVTVSSPAHGNWTARVTGFNLPFPDAQSYSLVSSFSVSTYCPPEDDEDAGILPLCKLFPKICEPLYVWPPRWKFLDDGWLILPPRHPIPLDEICNYVINCPGCSGNTNSLCPGFTMIIAGLPARTPVVVFDQHGNLLKMDSSGRKQRQLTVPDRKPGVRAFFAVVPPRSQKSMDALRLKITVDPPRKVKAK